MIVLWICWYTSMGLMTCVVSKAYRLAVPHVRPRPHMTDTELAVLAFLVWPLVLLVGLINLHMETK